MTTVTLRSAKGSALTFSEMDTDFSNLNQFKVEQDANGNVSIDGTTTSAWGTSFTGIDGPGGGSLVFDAANGRFGRAVNAYYDGTNWRYKANGPATYSYSGAGASYWLTAATGTAGAVITWTQGMTLDANSNLGVNTAPNASYRIHGYSTGANIIASEGTTDASFINKVGGSQALYLHSTAAASEINELRAVPINVVINGTTVGQFDTSFNFLLKGSGGIGYGTGSGGTVTQATSKTTGVTLNKPSGKITMNAAALAANATAVFTLTNSAIAAGDTVSVNVVGGNATAATYRAWAEAAGTGSCLIVVQNISAGSLSEAVQLQYNVHKGATA